LKPVNGFRGSEGSGSSGRRPTDLVRSVDESCSEAAGLAANP